MNTVLHSNKIKQIVNFKEKKTQQITTLTLTFLALSLFGIFAIGPTLSTIAGLKKQISDSLSIRDALETKIKNMRSLQEQYASMQKDITSVGQVIPQNSNIPLFVAQIQALAKQNAVGITQIQVFQVDLSNLSDNATTHDDKIPSFAFSFTGQGTYDNLKQFLKDFSYFNRLVNLDTISLDSQSVTNNSLITVSIRGKAYFKK